MVRPQGFVGQSVELLGVTVRVDEVVAGVFLGL